MEKNNALDVLNGILSEENLQRYQSITPKGIRDLDVNAINSKYCDYVMENWNDAEALCVELEKQFPQFMFVLYFEQNDGSINHVFHAIARKKTRIKHRKLLQEMALTFHPQYHPDYEIDFDEKVITEL